MPVNDFSWTELTIGDPAAAAEFYGSQFEWRLEHLRCDAGTEFEVKPDSDPCAGITVLREPDVPPDWMPYVSVGDLDASGASTGRSAPGAACGRASATSASTASRTRS